MSIAAGTNSADDQTTHNPDFKISNLHLQSTNGNARPEKIHSHDDEYTTLLKKHLQVVEGELIRLKGSQKSVPTLDPLCK